MTFFAKASAACAVLSCLLSFSITAQKINTSFKNGVQFATADTTFSLTLRFRVQSRVGYLSTSESDFTPHEFDFRVRRMRLRLDGFVLNPRLTYQVQLSFSRADQDWDVSGVPNVLRDAMVWYQMKKGLSIGIGQGKLPGNRQRVISSGEQQFADRSIVNNNLTLDRDVGLFAYYSSDNERFAWRLKGAITNGEGRNALPSDKGLAYTGRLELLPLGAFSERNDYSEGDLLREPRPKLSVAATLHFNDQAKRTMGELGFPLYEPRDLNAYHVDLLFKYNGWALSSEYLNRTCDNPKTYDSDGNLRYVYVGQGINTQLSYCTRKMWEVALRHSYLTPHTELYDVETELTKTDYGICLNKYLNKHKVKLQTDFIYERLSDPASHEHIGGTYQVRFQIELGI